MTDIVVKLGKEDGGLEHLEEKGLGSFWIMHKRAAQLTLDDKVFIICEGYVRGYFTIQEFDLEGEGDAYDIIFDEWFSIKLIPVSQLTKRHRYQGFKYRDFEFEVVGDD